MNMKTCSNCKTPKPATLEYFYQHLSNADNLQSTCIDCYKAERTNHPDNPHNVGEKRFVDYLLSNGVYATLGKYNRKFKWADVVAWGCVPIELKSSIYNAGRYEFRFTAYQQKRGLVVPIVVLETIQDDISNYHFLKSSHEVFYRNGKLKTGLAYIPYPTTKRKNRVGQVPLTKPTMDAAHNAINLIETERQSVIRNITDCQPSLIVEIPKPQKKIIKTKAAQPRQLLLFEDAS